MNVLLTGATGFIGSAVTTALKNSTEYNVTALSSRQIDGITTILHNGYKFDTTYLSSQGCDETDVLIHLGAFIPKSTSAANDLEMTFSNIANTMTLLKSNLPKLKKVIYISTVDVYKSNNLINESVIPNPVSLYGHSKLYCEKIIQSYAKEKNISCIVLRLGHVFGPGEEIYKKVIPNAIRSILSDSPVQIYNGGKDKRSYIYIDDVVKTIINSISYTGKVSLVNVTGNEPHSISELIDYLEVISEKKVNREFIDTGVPPRDVIFDCSLLKSTFLSDFTSVADGLKKEFEYMEALQ